MDSTIISTVISALLSVVISSIISYKIASRKNINDEEGRLNGQILTLNKISIKYPYLEEADFCKSWYENRNNKDKKYLRYDVYCLYKGDKTKIENFIGVKELVQTHKLWWEKPTGIIENANGYNSEFREYIETFLK